ncbi:hypothetical protein [Luteimicrobium subarcticum]|uniref:hypothetical protein n=1 Tax=Luteimicrobium subarcticum TaxID=620910 RepID=UPI0012FE2841|nr:hypothetical protein [Luteimicrobium subarcticum]
MSGTRQGRVGPTAGRGRPALWQMVIVVALAGAAIAFVVAVTVGVLHDGVGTGDPFDYPRALWRETTDAATWRAVGLGALVGAVVTLLVGAWAHLRRALARRRTP